MRWVIIVYLSDSFYHAGQGLPAVARSLVALHPRPEPGGLAPTFLERVPDLGGKVDRCAAVQDRFNRLQHGCGRHESQGGDVPQLIELEAIDREVTVGC